MAWACTVDNSEKRPYWIDAVRIQHMIMSHEVHMRRDIEVKPGATDCPCEDLLTEAYRVQT